MISRSALVAALVVVELGIVGMAANALAGDSAGVHPRAYGFHPHVHFGLTSSVTAPARFEKTLVAGDAPHVVIDVHNIDLVINVHEQPLVHAAEGLHIAGYSSGALPPIALDRTADGVRFTASQDDVHIVIGDVTRSMRIEVPEGARVDILSSGHVEATGLRTKLTAHTPLGDLRIRDHRGDLDLSTGDGKIELVDVQAADIAADTHDGRLYLTRVSADRIDAHSNYGRIYAVDVRAKDGALSTHYGRVSASFTATSDAKFSVTSRNEHVTVAGVPSTETGRHARTFQLGAGTGTFEISTDDGAVNISQGASD